MASDFTLHNISSIQDYVHSDDHTQPTYEMTPGFKPFTVLLCIVVVLLLVCDSASWVPCEQRLLFARQLIPRKCSLCSQGTSWAEYLTEPLKGDTLFLLGFYC